MTSTLRGSGGRPYRVDGDCIEQCDCGATNPCGEYIFNHSGAAVDGQTFRDWFINEYMVSNETLLHLNPETGKKQVIGMIAATLNAFDPSLSLTSTFAWICRVLRWSVDWAVWAVRCASS